MQRLYGYATSLLAYNVSTSYFAFMNKLLRLFPFLLLMSFVQSDKPAYLLYDKKGATANYADLLSAAENADVVFFGEMHDNPICHWLQLQLTKDLYNSKKNDLILAAEMFEADDQLVLNEYVGGLIKESNFEKEAKLWNNYATDYKPLVNFARQNGLQFIATNIPRRYASMVATGGMASLEKLDKEAQRYIAPLPVEVDMELPGYKAMIGMMGGAHGGGAENMVNAQAIKDATMGYRISEQAKNGKVILHFNGTYHTDNFEGIAWYLRKYNKKLKVVTISSLAQEDISSLSAESKGIADFVICIPKDMTKTY